MKKILTFIFTILSAFVVFALTLSFKASASESGITMMNGAQVRTAEDTDAKQGIKFTAEVTALPEGSTHGFYVAKGDFTAAELLAKLAEFGAKSEENQEGVVSDFAVTGTNTTFSVVLYGVPESDYLQDITVLAYVKLADGTVETPEESVARNLAEVAIYNATGDLANNKLINDVVKALNDDYKVEIVDAHGDLCYVNLNTNDLSILEALFVADVNEFVGQEILTVNSTAYNWYWNFTSDSKNDLTDARFYKFLNDEVYGAKWNWILKWMYNEVANEEGQAHQSSLNTAVQIQSTLEQNPVYSEEIHQGVSSLWLGRHLVNALYNFFNSGAVDYEGYPTYHFATAESLAGYEEYNNVAYWQLAEAQAVGTTVPVNTPTEKLGYNTVWTLNGEEYTSTDYVLAAEEVKFVAKYTPINYNVSFFNGETELTTLSGTYNIESIFELPLVLEGAVLEGWYDNPEFEGEAVTQITVGNTGDKVYYAKTATKVADLVVDQTLTEGQTVAVNGIEYTFGTDAFATISDALAAAEEGQSIYLVAGTYNEDFTISKNNIKILGPNFSKTGSATDRAEEAVLTGVITLTTRTEGRKFYGLKFSGNAQIVSENVLKAYQDKFEFVNNVVESSLTSGSFLDLYNEASYGGGTNYPNTYSENIIIDNNVFAGNGTNTSDLIAIGDTAWLTFTHNTFYNIGGTVLHIYDSQRGLVNGATISNNTFDNIGNTVININWFGTTDLYAGNTATIFKVCDNTFTNTTAVNFKLGSCNNVTKAVYSFTITGNLWSQAQSTSLSLPARFAATWISHIELQAN